MDPTLYSLVDLNKLQHTRILPHHPLWICYKSTTYCLIKQTEVNVLEKLSFLS